jgi:hypothetical protein
MAYVKARTRGGSVSTALVEAYRDPQGRPRQRVLANLHGEPDLVSALAKLAARRADLQEERAELMAVGPEADDDGYYDWRRAEIEANLAVIQRDGVVIKKHCTATPDEIQQAIQAYKKRLHEAECLALGMAFGMPSRLREAKATRRRLRSI